MTSLLNKSMNLDKITKIGIAASVVALTIWAVAIAALIYMTWHFVSKCW